MIQLSRRALLGGLAVAAAGCSSRAPVEQNFAPLDYDYLSKIRLNVGTVDVDDDWSPSYGGSREVGGLSPVTPVAALRTMGQERIVAGGGSGRAVFKIEDASIVRGRRRLQASFGVQLAVISADERSRAYAEARVARSLTLTDDEDDDEEDAFRAALYRLTSQAMDDMNVEFEFQVRRSLKDFILAGGATGTAPAPGAVEQQSLPAPPRP